MLDIAAVLYLPVTMSKIDNIMTTIASEQSVFQYTGLVNLRRQPHIDFSHN